MLVQTTPETHLHASRLSALTGRSLGAAACCGRAWPERLAAALRVVVAMVGRDPVPLHAPCEIDKGDIHRFH
jgi:hypothetical protein